MATSKQRVVDEDSEGLGGVIHLPLASYCGKVSPRSPPNRNLDSPPSLVREEVFVSYWVLFFLGWSDTPMVDSSPKHTLRVIV